MTRFNIAGSISTGRPIVSSPRRRCLRQNMAPTSFNVAIFEENSSTAIYRRHTPRSSRLHDSLRGARKRYSGKRTRRLTRLYAAASAKNTSRASFHIRIFRFDAKFLARHAPLGVLDLLCLLILPAGFIIAYNIDECRSPAKAIATNFKYFDDYRRRSSTKALARLLSAFLILSACRA